VISARHTHLSEKVKAYAQEKVGKLERFDESVAQAKLVLTSEFHGKRDGGERADELAASEPPDPEQDCTLQKPEGLTGDVGAAELIVSVARGHAPFVAHAEGGTLYAAIDLVVDKMERQLRKYREKLKDRHRQAR
jgi:ribosomal subunit interface protein